MNLIQLIFATLLAGIGSVWLAALLSFFALSRFASQLLSLAAGALLATAFLHLLPEAFEAKGVEPHTLFALLLGAMVFFFLLDKAELYHHGHEHCQHDAQNHKMHDHPHDHAHDHGHGHGHDMHQHGSHSHGAHPHGSWAVLLGDSVHALVDGVLIAAAFAASPHLGWAAALAVLAHEVPHHMGDLIVLTRGDAASGLASRSALIKVSLAGVVTVLGGLLGWYLLAQMQELLPMFLVVAASSFIYVALADLIPQLQRRMNAKETALQVAWLLAGMGLVALVTLSLH